MMDIELAIHYTKTLLKPFEGLRLKPYLCSAGVATIGWGSTFYEDGRRVKLSDPAITEERAEELLDHMIGSVFMPKVIELCPGIETPQQLGALTDFAFNVGVNALKNSTLRKKVNTEDWEGAKKEILKWNKGGGKVLSGLTKRRIAESRLL